MAFRLLIDLSKKKFFWFEKKISEFYNSDKAKYQKRLNYNYKTHNYGPFYDAQFKKMKHKKLNILEIGSFKGSSAAAFMHYFKNSNLYCVDVDHKNFMFKSNRIKLFKLDYMNLKSVKRFCRTYKNFFDKMLVFCPIQIQTVPIGLSLVPPLGPAIPVTAIDI